MKTFWQYQHWYWWCKLLIVKLFICIATVAYTASARTSLNYARTLSRRSCYFDKPFSAISESWVTMGRPMQWMPALWEQKYLAGVEGSGKNILSFQNRVLSSLLLLGHVKPMQQTRWIKMKLDTAITMGLYYIIFYGLIYGFCNKLVFVSRKPFPPSLMFVGEARSIL